MKISSYLIICTIVFLPCFYACSNTSKPVKMGQNVASSELYEGFKSAQINDLLILPVLVRGGGSISINDPEKVLGQADRLITNLLVRAFDMNTDISIYDTNTDEYWALLPETGITKEVLFKKATEISKTKKSQYVVFAVLDNKGSRTGGGFGSERTSSVSYRIWLYDSFSDKIIWSSAYQSKEDSLTSNLFEVGNKLESGIGFKTSEELIKIAFRSSAENLKRELLRLNNLKNMPKN